MPDHPSSENDIPPQRAGIIELVALFLRMGFTAFGGPAAHIALFEDEVVRRRKWLSHEEFLDLLSVTNLIPGPNSTEMVIHIGRLRAGLPGMIAAGLAFILPAAGIVGVCAWLYVRYGTLPAGEGVLYGVKPVVAVIIVQALWALWKKAAKTHLLVIVALFILAGVSLGMGEIEALVLAGSVTAFFGGGRAGAREHRRGLGVLAVAAIAVLALIYCLPAWTTQGGNPFSLTSLFLFFLKVGSILYGSGYVLLAFIESSLVGEWAWITQAQLMDAVAVGQVTPGPLFTTATFIGFLLSGGTGAAVATIGIFLPSFVFVGLSGPLIPRLRESMWAGAFLDGVNVASLALMAVVAFRLGTGSLQDPLQIGIACVAAVLLFRLKLNTTWLILGGGLIGWASSAL